MSLRLRRLTDSDSIGQHLCAQVKKTFLLVSKEYERKHERTIRKRAEKEKEDMSP